MKLKESLLSSYKPREDAPREKACLGATWGHVLKMRVAVDAVAGSCDLSVRVMTCTCRRGSLATFGFSVLFL